MSKVKVLFFAADPLSALQSGEARLLIDEEIRQIEEKVRAAEHRDGLDFDFRLAARPDDLLQALNETRPQVVHFSGHGRGDGLVLVGTDGQPHPVDAEALARLFDVLRGDIRLVVLNACLSLPQAEAIAQAVGCAIGTRGEISDEAARSFGASFYRAIAFGHSVQAAYDQARTALALEHVDARECPELLARRGVDPARLILIQDARRRVPTPPTRRRWIQAIGAALVFSTAAFAGVDLWMRSSSGGEGEPRHRSASGDVVAGDSTSNAQPLTSRPPTADSTGPISPVVAAARSAASHLEGELARARELHREKNYAAAHPIFERVADAGNPEAMGWLGMMYLEGQGVEQRGDLALPLLQRSAAAGDAQGMNVLGVAYERGAGVQRDYREAMRWYLRAQEKGSAEAMNNIAGLYRVGGGVQQDYAEAMRWYRKAADAGMPEAMSSIGRMFLEGSGVPLDLDQARAWFQRAADAGSLEGMVSLGYLYENAMGVPRDYRRAMTLYLTAAQEGNPEGMYNLGGLYFHGHGVPRNRDEAMRWFRRAADAGSAQAQAFLQAMDAG